MGQVHSILPQRAGMKPPGMLFFRFMNIHMYVLMHLFIYLFIHSAIYLVTLKVYCIEVQLISQLNLIESTCNAGDPGSVPGLGRSTGEGIGYPPQYSWASLVVQLVKDLPAVWVTLSLIPGLGRSPGERKGYLLQYSGLENSMDCIVHGVIKSWT